MGLIEKYLRAVAAQLSPDAREDVIAELRDDLMSRVEAKAAELGRPLTDAETEALLREMGHPLIVAARFGAGPQHVVGPELYPWWLFGVKVALTVLVVITVIGAVVRVLVGDVDAGQAVGQAFHGVLWSGMMIVGFATVAAFIIERQAEKPAFLTRWRVRDLGIFEAGLFTSVWAYGAKAAVGGETADGAEKKAHGEMSPTARAISSAAGWGVFALWWGGIIGRDYRPGELTGDLVREGVNWGSMLNETLAWLWAPFLIFAVARTVFHLMRAALGGHARFTALGDMIFSAVSLGFIGWLWLESPLAPAFAVDSVQAFVDRVRHAFETGEMLISTIVMASVALAFVMEVFTLLGAGRRLVTGR